ncbi:unnamed protein product [Miscanthus lutarioriparius]|uniref:Uncharacterized protein n=1 Tax=Miscanthus lutarioriparius TaxID=422564 RepID=A0A811NS25_9POAL|nr:unnamed protein product [Miscanthus lutarioriparius]
MKFIVAELVVHASPDLVRRGLGSAHDVTHIFGDGDVDPAEDALVHDVPVGIMALEVGWRLGDMEGEVEFAEEGIHEAAPFIVVGVSEGKNDGNMRLDVHRLENDGRGSGDGGSGSAGVRLVIEGRVGGVEDISIEEEVVIHETGGSGDGRRQRRAG